jgi:hypothetical protein
MSIPHNNPRQTMSPVVLAWAHDTGADLAKTNVNGGGMTNATIIERLG